MTESELKPCPTYQGGESLFFQFSSDAAVDELAQREMEAAGWSKPKGGEPHVRALGPLTALAQKVHEARCPTCEDMGFIETHPNGLGGGIVVRGCPTCQGGA